MSEVLTVASPKRAGHPSEWYCITPGTANNSSLTRYLQLVPGPSKSTVLDPWNGSGTTTCVASTTGISSLGLDLNPALTVIAQGRMVDPASSKSLLSLGSDLALHARDGDLVEASPDSLLSELLGQESATNGVVVRPFD